MLAIAACSLAAALGICSANLPNQSASQSSPDQLSNQSAGQSAPEASPECTLAPAESADANYEAIMGCLSSEAGIARLRSGVFLLPRGITMRPHSRLLGTAGEVARLQIENLTSMSSFVLETSTNSTVGLLTLDAANHLESSGCCTSIIKVSGNRSLLHDVRVSSLESGIGVHFADKYSFDNHLLNVNVSSCFYGVIFASGLDSTHHNVFEGGTIEEVACDAIVFVGYGEAIRNTVRNNGYNCGGQPPSSGAGLYCRGNAEGGLILENTVYDTCGMALDSDSCANFNVSFNHFHSPGNTFAGQYPSCAGAITAVLLDSSKFHVEGNVVSNDRSSNMQSNATMQDPNHIFRDIASDAFSDLPAGADTLLNFVVAQRPWTAAGPSVSHEVIRNVFSATCNGTAGSCVGVGYFSGRGTGLHGSTEWRPSRYAANAVTGSDIGSRRCGRNWYSDTAVCTVGASAPCNEDDHEHRKDQFRNDLNCKAYSHHFPWSAAHGYLGHLRTPLPQLPDSYVSS